MKKIIYTIFLLGTFLLSCNDFLDLPNDGRVTLEDVFRDPHMTGGYVSSCYSYIPSFYGLADFGMSYGNTFLASYTDEAHDVMDILPSEVRNWYTGNASASSYPLGNVWAHYFQGIRTCNVFLNRIKTATSPYSEDQRQEWIAQVYTLRAFYYLQLIKRYGGIPIITEELPEGVDYSTHRRNTFGDCAKQIFDDCDSALIRPVNIFGYGKGNVSDYGRMTPAIAHAVKSQTALYATSPLWYDGSVSYEKAAIITKTALDYCLSEEAGFKLFDKLSVGGFYNSAYEQFFLLQPDFERSKDNETILNSYSSTGNQLSVWELSGLPINTGMRKAGSCPSQELVDAYEMDNGVCPFLMDEYGVTQHDKNGNPVINPDPANTYDPQRPYDCRDPRLKATIYFNNCSKLGGAIVNTETGGACEISATDQKYTRTGYYLRKFNDGRSDINNNQDGKMRIFRLAELYLNFAEAANRHTKNPQSTIESSIDGSIPMSAADALNTVRKRAGLPDLSGNALTDAKEFEKRCCNERRVELAFEQHRFFDVRRWKILDKTDKNITGVKIFKLENNEDVANYVDGNTNYQSMTQASGTPFYNTVSQSFNANVPFKGVSVICSSSGLADATVRLSLYKWDAASASITGEALAVKTHTCYADNTALEVGRNTGETFAPGDYIWVLDNAKGHVKVAYTEGDVNGVINYGNNAKISGISYVATYVRQFATYNYERFIVSERLCHDTKFLKYPIPQNEINKLNEAGAGNWQNEGW